MVQLLPELRYVGGLGIPQSVTHCGCMHKQQLDMYC